jgi:hypothetical protein
VAPLWVRIVLFVFGLIWLTLGILTLTEGDTGQGVVQLALGVGWLLMGFFRDRLAPRFEAARERQCARVEGKGAHSFLPDTASRPQNK